MELQVENSSSICVRMIVAKIIAQLSGNHSKNTSVIRVSNDNLSTNGELYFLSNLKAWKNLLHGKNTCDGRCSTIFQHFQHVHSSHVNGRTDTEVTKEVLQLLISYSNDWPMKIERYSLEKEKVCLFLHRTPLIVDSIKTAITKEDNFGRTLSINKVFNLQSLEDKESQLTTTRLHLIQSVTENILRTHGCNISEEDPSLKFIFTTKSQGKENENFEKYVCGVVKNSELNTKEKTLTWKEYIKHKRTALDAVNEHRNFENFGSNEKMEDKNLFLETVANAMATFELLSVKPSRAVFVGCNSAFDKNMKDVTFILYNATRIIAILDSYNRNRVNGKYPDLPNINDVDLSLLKLEAEWELIYNFIIGYPEMLRECLQYEPVFQTNPQLVCKFLSRLCHIFSTYYRRTRILTEPHDHLMPTMMARLYMLRALQIVMKNAFSLLNIAHVSRM